ncbi:hypothetical protein O5202_26625, partial [Escherichia coli]|nr:hypothetical protein [Escherichia coli]
DFMFIMWLVGSLVVFFLYMIVCFVYAVVLSGDIFFMCFYIILFIKYGVSLSFFLFMVVVHKLGFGVWLFTFEFLCV